MKRASLGAATLNERLGEQMLAAVLLQVIEAPRYGFFSPRIIYRLASSTARSARDE